jgi:DNA mismatch endonuclease (patch repair protein)
MADIVDKVTRSRMMARIRAKDTKPELLVRRYLWAAGLRFRLHAKGMPGTPDIVLPRFRTAIFVNGCFWHRHSGCRYATQPKSNVDFWNKKFAINIARDTSKAEDLIAHGWKVLTIWGCETGDDCALDELFWQVVAPHTGSGKGTAGDR